MRHAAGARPSPFQPRGFTRNGNPFWAAKTRWRRVAAFRKGLDGIVTAVRACGHPGDSVAKGMTKISYSGYRFPPEIIQQAIWLYVRFTLSFLDVEDLLAERGIVVSYETVRRWVNHFGPKIAANLRKRRPKPHTNWHLDEVYLKSMHPILTALSVLVERRRCDLKDVLKVG